MWWSWTDRTSCRMEARSMLEIRRADRRIHKGNKRKIKTKRRARFRRLLIVLRTQRCPRAKARNNESIAAVYSAASCDDPLNGRHPACGLRGLQAIADFGVAAG